LKTIRKSNITWIIQKKPIGFGNAVHLAERYVGKDDFIVHASDTVIISKKKHPVSRFREIAKNNPKIAAIILCKKVKDPRRFGVLELKKISGHLYNVTGVEEKPSKPKSKNIILGLYYFKPIIFDALKKIKLGHGNEYQLTDAIKLLIANGEKVLAVELEKDEIDLDIGTLESYKNALTISYNQKILKQNNIRGI
jgi:dTDP-glucose pyrophosphorylase